MVSIKIKSAPFCKPILIVSENKFTASLKDKSPSGSSNFPSGPISRAIKCGEFLNSEFDLSSSISCLAFFALFNALVTISSNENSVSLNLFLFAPKVFVLIIFAPAKKYS